MRLRKNLLKPGPAEDRAVDVPLEELLPGCGVRGTLRIAPARHNDAFDNVINAVGWVTPTAVAQATALLKARGATGAMLAMRGITEDDRFLAAGQRAIPSAKTVAEVEDGLEKIMGNGLDRATEIAEDFDLRLAITHWGNVRDSMAAETVVIGCDVDILDLTDAEAKNNGEIEIQVRHFALSTKSPQHVTEMIKWEDGKLAQENAMTLVRVVDGLLEAVIKYAMADRHFPETTAPEVAAVGPKSEATGPATMKSDRTSSDPPAAEKRKRSSKSGKKTPKS